MLHENEAAERLSRAAAGPGIRLSAPSEGRVNLIAATNGLLVVNVDALARINSIENIVFATLHGHQPVHADQPLAGTISASRICPLAAGGAPRPKPGPAILPRSNWTRSPPATLPAAWKPLKSLARPAILGPGHGRNCGKSRSGNGTASPLPPFNAAIPRRFRSVAAASPITARRAGNPSAVSMAGSGLSSKGCSTFPKPAPRGNPRRGDPCAALPPPGDAPGKPFLHRRRLRDPEYHRHPAGRCPPPGAQPARPGLTSMFSPCHCTVIRARASIQKHLWVPCRAQEAFSIDAPGYRPCPGPSWQTTRCPPRPAVPRHPWPGPDRRPAPCWLSA